MHEYKIGSKSQEYKVGIQRTKNLTQIKSNISEYVDECYDYDNYGDSDNHDNDDNHDNHDDHDQGKARQRRGFLRVLSEQRTPYMASCLAGRLLMMHQPSKYEVLNISFKIWNDLKNTP